MIAMRTKLLTRHGVTLTEVLVAIFIMGIGLLSLLVLFPLGALQMAQAIREDRCTHAAMNARAIANLMIPYTGNAGYTLKDDPYTVFKYYATPSATNPAVTVSGLPLPLPVDGPSYPVYIDPIGVKLTASPGAVFSPTGAPSFSVYNNPAGASLGLLGTSPGFPRVCPSFMNLNGSFRDLERWCMMLDDIQFAENGVPAPGTIPTTIQRENRYSWAWLCRQTHPYSGTPPTPMGVELTIVVYDRRPLQQGPNLAPTGTPYMPPMGETPCTATFTQGSSAATLTWAAGLSPNLRNGVWILDATPANTTDGKPNGYFYRVVNAVVAGNSAQVELHMPARVNGTIAVVMDGVVEVYEKGSTTPQ